MTNLLKIFTFLCLITSTKAAEIDLDLQDLQDPPIKEFQQFIDQGFLKTGGFRELMTENKDPEKPHYPRYTWEKSSEHFTQVDVLSESCPAKGEFYWQFGDTNYGGRPAYEKFSTFYLNPELVKHDIDIFEKIKTGEMDESIGWKIFSRYCEEAGWISGLCPRTTISRKIKHLDLTPINQLFWNRVLLIKMAVDSLIEIRKQKNWDISNLSKVKEKAEKLLDFRGINRNSSPNIMITREFEHFDLIHHFVSDLFYIANKLGYFMFYENRGFTINYKFMC